jgi:hypothetical protein
MGSNAVEIGNDWESLTLFGFESDAPQDWIQGFAGGEMFGLVLSFAPEEYPVVVKKVYVHVDPVETAQLHVWSVSIPDMEAVPSFSLDLLAEEGPFYGVETGLSLMNSQDQLRIGVESDDYQGLSVPHRTDGTGLHLVKTCDSLIPDFGCLLEQPVWKPASAATGSLQTFWEIHVEVETAGGAGYCE